MKRTSLKSIEEYSEEEMAKLGLYGVCHVRRVRQLCIQLAKSQKGTVDSGILEIAALLHDVAKHLEKTDNSVEHGKLSAEMSENFLRSIGFNEEKTRAICYAIRAHTLRGELNSIEAKILHDADFLDKMGTVGIATVFLRACMTNTTIEQTLQFWKNPSKQSWVGLHMLWLHEPHFYTTSAVTLARRRNKIVPEFFKQLEKEIELQDT